RWSTGPLTVPGLRGSNGTRKLLFKILEFLQPPGHLGEALIHEPEDGFGFERTITVPVAGGHSGKDFNSLLNSFDGPNVELTCGDGFENIVTQHQVLYVGRGNQHALRTGKALDAANVEETFDLFVYAADGLNIALLVHGTGNREILPQRQI